jgi:hypothetical protein
MSDELLDLHRELQAALSRYGVTRYTMDLQFRLERLLSPRCGARTRSGSPCQSPAMPNGRCRMHGGKSSGAPKGNRNAWKHGRYSVEATMRRREAAALLRAMRAIAKARYSRPSW